MSHILFISHYYPPEKAAAAVCVSETAKRLVGLGHQVTILTTVPNYPTGIVPLEYRGRVLQEEIIDNVHVVRVWSYVNANKGFLKRIVAQLSFGCIAPILGWRAIGHPDIIIVGSPPLFNVIAARLLARFKKVPFIFWVADLWPESAVQLGMLRNRLLIRLSEWLEWSTYQRAHSVWVVTQGVRDFLIQRGLSPKQLFLLTNGVDTEKFRPLSQLPARAELCWDNRFTVLYAGNHGLVYSMTALLEAAEQLLEYRDIHFILVGDGTRKAEMIAYAYMHNLKNITFLNAVPHDSMPKLLAAADICLIPLSKMSLLETSIPLKMLELMACERPFILGAKGIAAQIVQETNAGLVIEPDNAYALALSILYLKENPDIAEQLGQRGRAYVKARFDYQLLTIELDKKLQAICTKEEKQEHTLQMKKAVIGRR